jgi:hypothetical protein
MFAAARSTVAMAVVLALGGCGSSPNGPTGVYADGAAGPADAGAVDTGPDVVVEGGLSEAGTGVGVGCPATFRGRTEGTPCFGVLGTCDYAEGRCGCIVCGVGANGFGFAWSCRPWESGGAGCPSRSPAPGSPCDGEGLVCRFDAYCSVSVGDDLTCMGGTWQPAPPLAPCGVRVCPM